MKTHTYIFIICAVSALAFFGCAKKSAPQANPTDSQNETVSAAQSEPSANAAVAQETQPAKDGFDAWSEEEKYAIQGVRKRIRWGVGGAALSKPIGTWKFYYNAGRNNERRVLAPVAFFDDDEMYEQYPFLMKGDPNSAPMQCSSTDEYSAMAFKERDKDDCITVLFTTDQLKTWATSRIKIDGKYLTSGFPYFHIFCVSSEVGYLKLCSRDDAVGGPLYRTDDSGVSWEQVGEVPESCKGSFSAQGDTVYLNAKKGAFFCLFKSDDYANWTEIDFPIDTGKYKGGDISAFRFEGKYGVVEAPMALLEKGEKRYEKVLFSTKDGGENWIAWE